MLRIAHSNTRHKPFHGGYRNVFTAHINAIIEAVSSKRLSTQDMRVYCAYLELLHKDDIPTVAKLRTRLKRRDRGSEVEASLKRVLELLSTVDTSLNGHKCAVPRKVLKYIAQDGERVDGLVLLICGLLALRNEQYEFRFKACEVAERVGVQRSAISMSMSRLACLGIVKDLNPEQKGMNHPNFVILHGKRYRWGFSTTPVPFLDQRIWRQKTK